MTYVFGNRQIFGRESELSVLRQAYGRVSQTGYGEIVLIGGPAGYGKTSVVHSFLAGDETIKFAIGKADEALRRVPFSAVLKALSWLLPPADLDELASIRDAGGLATPSRIKDRLMDVVRSNASPSSPLVLFIDDLQWLDESSQQLMRMLSERGLRDLLLVGTYRTDEKIEFRETGLDGFLGDSAVRVTDILLKTLPYEAVEGLISAQNFGQTSKPLARLVQSVASGNPFHIQLILNVLSKAETAPDLAHFVSDQKNWGLGSLLNKIVEELPGDTRTVLQFASCVGFTSDHDVLVEASKMSAEQLERSLAPAVVLGLVRTDGMSCQFSHDAVREHIRRGLPKDEKAFKHSVIARSMLSLNLSNTDRVLAVAEQIVKAKRSPLLLSDVEAALEALARATEIAKAVGSFDGALRYAEKGIDLSSLSNAPDRYRWRFLELRCAILVDSSGSAIADSELDYLASQATSPLDHSRAARLKAAVLILRGQFEDAINLALAGLQCLGIALDRRPSKSQLDAAFEVMTAAFRKISREGIDAQPRLKDEAIVVAMDLLATLQSSFFSDDGLKFLHSAKIVELSAEYGVSGSTCYGLAWCGVCVASEYADYATALSMAEAAVELSNTNSFQAYRTSALVALDQVSVWLRPLSYALERSREAFEHGKGSGDISMACYATNHVVSNLLAMGAPLAVVSNEVNRGLAMARSVGFEEVIRILEVQSAFATALKGYDVEDGAILKLATSDAGSEMSPLVFWGHLFEGIAAFYNGGAERASGLFAEASKWTWTTPAHIHIADLYFYSAFAALILENEDAASEHRDAISEFARQNPATFLNKLALLNAETARIAGDVMGALRFYEESIRAAKEAGFSHELALAHERAGRLSLKAGLLVAASEHIREAQRHFRKWGGVQQAQRLQTEFADMLRSSEKNEVPSGDGARIDLSDAMTNELVAAATRYSGAMRGQLISVNGTELAIVANTSLRDGITDIALQRSPFTNDMAPASIIRLVVETAHSLRYGHALHEAGDDHGPSLQECPVRSLLCVPLKDRDRVFSILYLENNAVSDAFSYETERAIELFVIATTQAIRLKAQLEEQKVDSVAQQTRDNELVSARADLIKNSHITVLGGMAASIAHEVNQPLSAIVTHANAGLRWLRQATPQVESAINNFAKIEQSSLRASSIISALRSLAKQSPANLEFLNINDLVAAVLGVVQTDRRAEGVEIECALSEGGELFADAIQIQQVVLNLMTNALDAMESVRADRRLHIESAIRDSFVVLSVSDTGSGIPANARESIFDPFYTTKETGLGMGLAICKTIAEVHGGGLSVGTSNGDGTTMILRLPLTVSPVSGENLPPSEDREG